MADETTDGARGEATLTDSLKRLHGMTDPNKMPERDTIAVMHESEFVRSTLARVLGEVLPGFEVDMSASSTEVAAKLAGAMETKVVLVLAEIEDPTENAALLQSFQGSSRRANFASVPLVAMSQDIPLAIEKGQTTSEKLASLGIDGVLEIPYPERLRAVVSLAIMKRSEIFGQIEKDKRKEIMVGFFDDYLVLVENWIESLTDVSFYPNDSEDLVEDDSKEAILVQIGMGLKKVAGELKEWQRLGEDPDPKKEDKLSHDIANSLAASITNLYCLEMRDDIGTSDKGILKIMRDELGDFNEYRKVIGRARNGQKTWSSMSKKGVEVSPVQSLEFPTGTVFCLVDDSHGVLSACARGIKEKKKDGGVHTAKNRVEFAELLMRDDLSETPVFLLDNDLGRFDNGDSGHVYGHSLVAAIRKRFPRAVIVCHTSDAVNINADQDNAYRRMGVEVIGKREWNALTRILQYSFSEVV